MAKRAFDVIIALFIAPVAALVAGIMALVLAIELRGNPFFVQERIGLNGTPFRMYKLRTMRHPAPGEQRCYRIDDWSSFVFNPPGEEDPRVTRAGAFARKLSLDEIPNLINVLRGEMSLVGPRPEIPEIVAQYPEAYHRRHSVLPGVAGPAQVNGRSDLPYDEILQYDLAYVDHHSVLTDIQVLAKTALVVLSGSGAR
ncbi:MAG: sugar transferase [Dehalococcoidia bacterium]|nr:sugar transferase [Dehalococcoidia bacterium]